MNHSSEDTKRITRRKATGPVPLSFAQQRLWFLDQLEPGNSVYNIPAAVRLTGPLNVIALQQSLNEIVRRHEALRTTFVAMDGQSVQVITPALTLSLPVMDLRDLSETEREAQVQRLVTEESQRPFDLAQGPLLRTALLRLGEEEYVFLLVMHHTVSDGWSIGVFFQELATLYKAFLLEKPSPLPELPIQYADFAVWQREWLQGEVLEKQLSYWKKKLHGVPPVLELPIDRPRPAVQTHRGARQSLVLSPTLTNALKALSRQEGVTLFMTLLAAFKTLLYRYKGQEDIIVGSPIANRNRGEIEGLIGFFVNTVVLRTDFCGNPTFRELLARVREVALGAYAHQDLPFEKLVEELQPEWNVSDWPLFQVMFAVQNVPAPAFEFPGLRLNPIEVDNGTAKFDLTLSMVEGTEELRGTLEYNTDLFDAATIERMAGHFQVLLENIVTNPDRRLSDVPILTEAERHQLLVEWNDTKVDYPEEICLHHLFESQVERTPEAIAVIMEAGKQEADLPAHETCLTYRELNQQANQLAHYLQRLGVGSEVLVGICAERSLEMVVGLLGILKAGGAYVPLDPTYPEERLAFMLEDAKSPVLLTQSHLCSKLAQLVETFSLQNLPQLICLDTDWRDGAKESIAKSQIAPFVPGAPHLDALSVENPESGVTPDNLAYVIYTSGSTGRPKGVMNIHRAICNRLLWMQDIYQLGQSDRVLQKTPFSFDVSVWEFFWPLLTGAGLVMAQPEGHKDPAYLVKVIIEQQITTLHFVPSMLRIFLEEQNVESCDSIRRVICSGEALPFDLQERFFSRLDTELYNLYGPTEAAVDVTYWRCQPGSDRQIVPIGRPIANIQIYLLDSHLQPVPIGVPGELHIGGVGLARGYLNRPVLTAEKFIQDPFSDEPGARLYRTGDLARYLPDGNIEFLGRMDHQVKIRGFRIELGEIEAVLSQPPAVREAVVLAREDEPGDKRLVAYVVPDQDSAPTISELRSFLKEKLPEYMVPSAFVTLDALPLTPNGKVDRRALPAPDRTRPDLQEVFVAPRTPVEKVLAGIWSKVLMVERIGIYDNFFELGGHSLLAAQVISRVRDAFQVELPLPSVFEAPTIASLAENIEQARQEGGTQELPPLEPVPRDGPLPLTFAQEQIWFLQELVPDNLAYNAQYTIRFRGSLNVAVFEQALTEIVRRHEILRTTFSAVDGQLVQTIHPPWMVTVPVVDLRAVPEDRREAEAERLVVEAFKRPFDTTSLPLIRWTLLQLDAEDHILIYVEHHFVHDGWSFSVLLRELKMLYEAFSAGRPSPLPELPVQFADFAVWQRQWMEGEMAQAQLAYWKERLAGSPPVLQLPTDRPRPRVQSFQGAALRTKLSAQLYEELKALSLCEGVTLFMTLLAAFKVLLYRYTGQEDLPVGSGVANRRLRETEGLIGMIINMVVLRTDLSGNPTFRELLGRVREVTLGAYAHQDLPFEKLVEALQPARDLSRNPLFQVTFGFHDAPVPELEFSELTGSIDYRQNDSAKFDLNVIVIPRAEQLAGQSSRAAGEEMTMIWEYDTDLFDATTIERMAGHFRVLLENIVTNPDQRLSDVPILTKAERHQLLVEWNDTQTDYPKDSCIHQLFETQAKQTPDAVAVIFENQQLTYRELNARANQLAHHLQTLGVGPEMLVGTCMERSLEMVIGLLGILKAGGAYVPLDPTYPKERLAFMLKDTQTPVLLTQQYLLEELPEHGGAVVCLDSDWEIIAQESEENPIRGAVAENLAYVIYTSGSTGKPNGVLISHGAIANHCRDIQRYYQLTPDDRVLQFASLNFDASLEQILPTLIAGAKLVLRGAETWAPQDFYQKITDFGLTVINVPPGYWHQVAQEWANAPGRVLAQRLRLAIIGGDVMQPESLHLWRQTPMTAVRLLNAYGPTETTITATTFEVPLHADEALSFRRIPIGRPIANKRAYILDSHLQPVPVGVTGELYLGGAGLARGYLNRPKLTAERFIPNPFSEEPRARLYKTGDLARYLLDGNIEFLGRLDHQVKIRGFRIELGEIEAVLVQYPTVRETVVMAREDVPGEKRLVAYVVPNQAQAPPIGELRRFLKEKLPEYMVPSAFVILDALPLTPNGKVDRRALPAPDRSRPELGGTFVAPRTSVEEGLAGIWSEVLGLERIGVYDNFFELGGHSLLATRVISRLRKAFQVELPLRCIFEAPTVAELSRVIIAKEVKPGQTEKIARVLRRIKGMSTEDVRRTLQEKKKERGYA